jgi:hypothetical protein
MTAEVTTGAAGIDPKGNCTSDRRTVVFSIDASTRKRAFFVPVTRFGKFFLMNAS